MDWVTEPERKTPVVGEVDLLVCGGGFAGVSAAVCAARLGAKVMLLEKYGFLGGLVTSALVIASFARHHDLWSRRDMVRRGKGRCLAPAVQVLVVQRRNRHVDAAPRLRRQ